MADIEERRAQTNHYILASVCYKISERSTNIFMISTKTLTVSVSTLLVAIALVAGCDKKTDAQKAADSAKSAAESAQDAAKSAMQSASPWSKPKPG